MGANAVAPDLQGAIDHSNCWSSTQGRPKRMQTIWKKPVTIALEGPDQWVVIQTTQAATWALIEDWPTDEGPALDRACAVCADVISGKRSREEARQAFIEAAIEAGIPIKV
jgi:hypothetical protein